MSELLLIINELLKEIDAAIDSGATTIEGIDLISLRKRVLHRKEIEIQYCAECGLLQNM